MALSKFGTGDGEWQLGAVGGGAAEAHALERPLDDPAAGGQPVQKLALVCYRVDQNGALLTGDDKLHQLKRVSRWDRDHWADMARSTAVADQRHGVAARDKA